MQAIYVFAAATALVTLVALAICLLFRRTLSALLIELCEGETRGRFWTLFGQTSVVLATFFAAIVFAPSYEPRPDQPLALFAVFVRALRGGVFGLLGALAVLGAVMVLAILSFNARQRRAPQTRPTV